jgi:formamidopyrimidine-DNA glycosylase
MPELPEVETIRRRLAPVLDGRTVADVGVSDDTVSDQSAAELRRLAAGRRVVAVRRRGKYLAIDLGEVWFIVHLRMTGQLLFKREEGGRRPRLVLTFDPPLTLFFYDTRRFGRVWAVRRERVAGFFAEMGVEPLEAGFTVTRLRELLDARRQPLKAFLLDQRRIAGVGNIYADEALFRAGLHPLRAAGAVGARGAQRLHDALIETLELGIANAGSSVDTFVDPEGASGTFQELLNVYQRTGEPCHVCGTPIERTVVSGRGTHFCPRCQPRRRMGRHVAMRRARSTPKE